MSRLPFVLGVLFAAVSALHAGSFNGGRVVPVHRLPALDANGDVVNPSERLPRAISFEKTCAQCHNVAKMAKGTHFAAGRAKTAAVPEKENWFAREPWFSCDTNDVCRIAQNPAMVGMSAWEWSKNFARAFPGGGLASDTNAMAEAAGERQRWFVTGPIEKNCMACHQTDGLYDPSEWAKQTLRENWSGAPLAASGLARVEGMNARLNAAWDPSVAENPDDHLFKVPQKIVYNPASFDDKGRFLFRVGKPKNENCLACHAACQVPAKMRQVTTDVHLKRGMACVDCHRNGMKHKVQTKTCAACHLDPNGEGPKPKHVGFPLVHFEKLSCAVCHAGVTTRGRRSQVMTARANRIGLYGKAQWATDAPFVEEPFFRKDADGIVQICRRATTTDGEVCWPFHHDVRPARQARGAAPEKCAACHTYGNAFFEDWENPVYFSAFNLAFLGRPVFKVVLWFVFGFLCLAAAAAAGAAFGRIETRRNWFTALVVFGFAAAVLYLALSGAWGWCAGGMTGWALMLHMVAGGALASAAFVLVLLGRPCTGVLRVLWLVLGAATVFTAVMPMMTVFGSEGQLFLLWAHRLSSFAFAAVSLAACAVSKLKGNVK